MKSLTIVIKSDINRVLSHLNGIHVTLFFLSVIMNRKPRLAWELYLKMETSGDSFSLLQLISNDCYKVFTKVISTLNHRYNILPQCRVKNLQISSNKVLPSMVGLVGPRYFC